MHFYDVESFFDCVKEWMSSKKGLVLLAVLFALTLLLGVVYQPWPQETIKDKFPDVFLNAEKNGIDNIIPVMTILFKGVVESMSCADGVLDRYEAEYSVDDNILLLTILSAAYFAIMTVIGIIIREVIFEVSNSFEERIQHSISGWLFENIWLTLAAYLWWLIGGLVDNNPKTATIVMSIILLAALLHIFLGIVAAIAYVGLLYCGCYIILNAIMNIPAELFPVRIAVMIVLGLIVRMMIDFIVDKIALKFNIFD